MIESIFITQKYGTEWFDDQMKCNRHASHNVFDLNDNDTIGVFFHDLTPNL